MHQIRFRPGLCPGPHSGGAYSALSDPLAGLRGLTSIGRRGKGEGKGREEGKTKEREGPPSQIPGSAPAIDDDDDVVGAEMLKQSDMRRQDASVRCLEVLTSSKPNYWKQLLEAGQSHSFTPSCNVSVILLSGVIAAFSVASMGAKSKSKKITCLHEIVWACICTSQWKSKYISTHHNTETPQLHQNKHAWLDRGCISVSSGA